MAKTKERPLGKTQESILHSLRTHKVWHEKCGWVWNNDSGTRKLLDSLVKRGLATHKKQGRLNVYRPVPT